jgi:hypothetical protein
VTTCPTRSGRYVCTEGEAGHAGPCETTQPQREPRLGPYRDAWRADAYLRGQLDARDGATLDAIGSLLRVDRREGEDDCAYRERIYRWRI